MTIRTRLQKVAWVERIIPQLEHGTVMNKLVQAQLIKSMSKLTKKELDAPLESESAAINTEGAKMLDEDISAIQDSAVDIAGKAKDKYIDAPKDKLQRELSKRPLHKFIGK